MAQKRSGDKHRPDGRSGNGAQGRRSQGGARSRYPAAGQGGRKKPPSASRQVGGSRRGSDAKAERTHRAGSEGTGAQPRRRPYSAGGGPSNIPRWLREEIIRVTPKDRRDGALQLFSEAATDYADEKFGRAHPKLLRAKKLSSRAPAIRELLGLTAYRLGRWDEGLRELRAFRRMAGDTTHMPVEMDALRALGRGEDVRKTWALFQELGGRPLTDAEARVVFGSFLLDENDPRGAWQVTRPKRITKEARVGDLRRWYVAARAAARLGDVDTARQLARAIDEADERREIGGLEQLEAEIRRAGARAPE